jgi:hypothetical protein
MRAEYQEWPMHGLFKGTTIEEEARYCTEFSLEHDPVSACLHESRTSSNIDFSTGSTSFSSPVHPLKPSLDRA